MRLLLQCPQTLCAALLPFYSFTFYLSPMPADSVRSPFYLFYSFTFLPFHFYDYLIFSVIMVSAARMMVTIQKRMVIFDSCTTLLGPFQR